MIVARGATSFARRSSKYKPQPRILVVCEDEKSCRTYLHEAAQHFRCHADVEIAHIGRTDPQGIVAVAKLRTRDYDRVFCVIDRDTHALFDEAMREAERSPRVDVLASHPCYEFWLLLHFRMTRSPFAPGGGRSAADIVTSELRGEPDMHAYAKGASAGLFDRLLPRLPEARARAAQVLAQALEDMEPNPSTRLHELIDLFEVLGKPVPIHR